MRRLVVVLAAVVVCLISVAGTDAAVEPDGFVCAVIAPGNTRLLTFFTEAGDGNFLLNGFLRIGDAGERIPISGNAVDTQQGISFTLSGGSADAGIFTLVGRFPDEGPQATGACFGAGPCATSGQTVTYTLTLLCPTRF
jgi:hypothetical protein